MLFYIFETATLRWFDEYLSTLPRSESLKIETKSETCKFRFGDGEVFSSTKLYTIPIMIGNTQVQLDTHVVESDIPLLMSRESLKRAEADIDFERDTIKILGETIDLKISKSGHLMIPLITRIRCVQ